MNEKQNILTAGTNIDITNNIISTKNVPTLNENNTFTQQNTFTRSVRFSDTVKSYDGFTADNSSNSHYAKYSSDNIVYYKDSATAYSYEFPNSSGTLLTSNDVTDILKTIYPVGSVYINRTNNDNPGTLLGFGTWARISDRFLYAATTSSTILGTTGGESTHKLTIDEMPSHNHNFDGWGTVAGNNGYVSGAESKNILTTTSFSMNDTGGDQAHNNMPPYVVVSIWYRVG